jgi:hypothetical protein
VPILPKDMLEVLGCGMDFGCSVLPCEGPEAVDGTADASLWLCSRRTGKSSGSYFNLLAASLPLVVLLSTDIPYG